MYYVINIMTIYLKLFYILMYFINRYLPFEIIIYFTKVYYSVGSRDI